MARAERSLSPFKVGDEVESKPEWIDVVSRHGRVCDVEPWGDCGVVYLEGDHRGFASYVLERWNAG
jgi:hypothetical protein